MKLASLVVTRMKMASLVVTRMELASLVDPDVQLFSGRLVCILNTVQGHFVLLAGSSDLVVILGVITDFLHKPYNSIEDPLDLWFHNLTSGSVVPAFSVG